MHEVVHNFGVEEIQNEEMLYKCDAISAWKLGGLITKALLSQLPEAERVKLPEDWIDSEIVVDTRVHMLMKGMYPCIPGWHHDYVERNRSSGQPDYDKIYYHSEHLLFLIGDVAPTQFAVGKAEYNPAMEGTNVYSQWHKETENHIKSATLEVKSVPTNHWILFNDFSMHQGVAAEKNAWRFFMRVSRFFKEIEEGIEYISPPKYANQARKQVQVYMKDPFQGW